MIENIVGSFADETHELIDIEAVISELLVCAECWMMSLHELNNLTHTDQFRLLSIY